MSAKSSTEQTTPERTAPDTAGPRTDASDAALPEHEVSRRGILPSRQTLAVLALVAALLGTAAVLVLPLLNRGPFLPSPTLPWWVLAVAFAAAETSVLHIQRGREARSISMSELPLVLGLFFASPIALLVGRVVGGAVTLVVLRHSPLKTCFNLA